MKKKLFLVAALCLFLTCQAFAKMARFDVNDGDGWNLISAVGDKSIEFSQHSNPVLTTISASNDQLKNLCKDPDKVKSNVVQRIDMSESSSVFLIGMGVVIAILRKWRKSLNTPNESEYLKKVEAK